MRRLQADVVPHTGWNSVDVPDGSALLHGLEGERFYFVHSYAVAAPVPDALTTTTVHGEPFAAAVERGRAVGHAVPPREERRRRRGAARELGPHAVMTRTTDREDAA